MSNLLDHAKRELELAGIEEDVRPSLLIAVAAFSSYGHSGGSAAICTSILTDLLQYKNLTPLTDSPSEWMNVAEMSGTKLWQNIRNSECFSTDGGRTYWVLSEERRWIPWKLRRWLRNRSAWFVFPRHESVPTGFILGVSE